MEKKTQLQRLASLLLNGKTITVKQAEKFYGMKNLTARISELRDLGFNVKTEMTLISRRDARPRARYSMSVYR